MCTMSFKEELRKVVLVMNVEADLMRTIAPLIGLVSLGVTLLTFGAFVFLGSNIVKKVFRKTSPEK